MPLIASNCLWSPLISSDHPCFQADAQLPLDLVELPRLRLSFKVSHYLVLARLASLEHPGLEVSGH